MIKEAKDSNEVTVMTQDDFVSFEPIKRRFKQPRSMKITEILGYRITSARPDIIYTRLTHEPGTTWDEHNMDVRNISDLADLELQTIYNGPLAISEPKKTDLLAMCPYLQPQFRQFYEML